jgi:hypothetical protein
MLGSSGLRRLLTMAAALVVSSGALAADDGVWSVSKSSGAVWISTTGAEQASLKQEDTLKPGDTVRTGRNGRVLLVRGEETILVAPNSVVGMPTEKKDGMSTTILQQAGSILLEVEKRNVKHFEVETPYLAAVVKGTQFSVTVNATSTSVEVKRGQVEVSDFKSGQIAQIMPGQAATSFAHGKPGLSLSGSGSFNPIEQGKPRASSIERIPVPRGGLPAPHNIGDGRAIHALYSHASFDKLANASTEPRAPKTNAIHLSTALGEVRLNVQRATHGLAHGSVTTGSRRSASRDRGDGTIWSDNRTNAGSANALAQSGVNGATSAATISGVTNTSTSAAAVAAAAATDSGSGNGASSATGGGNSARNGNNGNGNGNAANAGNNGNHGNGNNGNGNGNGNGGVGNGNGNGNSRH